MPLAFLSGPDMMIVVALILILFGGKQVPQLMRSLGQGMGELQKGLEEAKRTVYMASQEVHAPPTPEPSPVRPTALEAQSETPLVTASNVTVPAEPHDSASA